MRVALVLCSLTLLAAPVLAQDEAKAPQASVRVTAVKGIGKLKKDVKPAIPPQLEPLRGLLSKCGYDRYDRLATPHKRGFAKTDFQFDGLPADHAAVVRWEAYEKKGGDLLLTVTVNKTAGEAVSKVASMKVRLKDGKSYMIKVPGAYADGDLLLIVTVSRAPFKLLEPKQD